MSANCDSKILCFIKYQSSEDVGDLIAQPPPWNDSGILEN